MNENACKNWETKSLEYSKNESEEVWAIMV